MPILGGGVGTHTVASLPLLLPKPGGSSKASLAGGSSPPANAFSLISDNFNDGTINATLWPSNYGAGHAETGGRATIPCDTGYNAFNTGSTYTFDSVLIEAFPPAAAGATSAYMEFGVHSAATAAGTDLVVFIDLVNGVWYPASRVDYWDATASSIAYNPTAHAWFRIRLSGADVIWETAPDGHTWTTQRVLSAPAWATASDMSFHVEAHRADGTANTAQFDNFNLQPGSVTTTPVSSTLDLRWAVAASVSSSADLQWQVKESVSSSADLRWTSYAQVSSTADLQWQVRNTTSSTLDARWAVLGSVAPSTADLRWSVGATVSGTADLRWAVRSIVAGTADIRWALSAPVTGTADIRWAVRSVVSANADLRWTVSALVSGTLDLRWTVRATVSNTADLQWAVRSVVSNTADVRWDVRNSVGATADLRWSVLNQVAATADLRWVSWARVESLLDLRWGVESNVAIESFFTGETPALPNLTDGQPIVIGTRFTPTANGQVIGVRIPAPTTPHSSAPKAGLYRNSDGVFLTPGGTFFTFPLVVGGDGWAEALFSSPVNVLAGVAYSVVVWSPDRYVATGSYPWPQTTPNMTTDATAAGRYDYSADFIYPTSQFANGNYFVDPMYQLAGSSTSVTSTADIRWQVRNAVTATADLRWQVKNSVSNAADLRWDVRNVASSTADLRWSVRSLVTATLDVRWGLLAPVSATADLRWTQFAQASNTADLRWASAGRVESTADLSWQVRNAASATLDLRWALLSQVSVVADLRWMLRGRVVATAQILWVVAGSTTPVPTAIRANLTDRFAVVLDQPHIVADLVER